MCVCMRAQRTSLSHTLTVIYGDSQSSFCARLYEEYAHSQVQQIVLNQKAFVGGTAGDPCRV